MKREVEESKLRAIFASSPDAITTSDLNGNITDCNQATLHLHGYSSKEELIGKSAFVFIAKRDHKRAMENLKKTMEQGSVRNIEYAFLTKDGHEFPAELSASVVKDSSGKITGFVAMTKDITERKKVEEALRESEEKLRVMFESISDGIAIIDLEGNVVEANEAHLRMFGYSHKEELIGQNAFDSLAEKDRVIAMEGMTKLFEEESSVPAEYTLRDKDGREFYAELTAALLHDSSGNPVGVVSVTRDITERKHMQKKLEEYSQHLEKMVEARTRELKESEVKLKDLFKTVPDSIAIVDLNGNLLEFNEATLELFGYQREEIIGKNVFDFIPEEDLERISGGFKQALEEGFVRTQILVLGKDRRKIPVELSASVWKDLKGNFAAFVAVLRDITERKRMEEQLLRSERLAAIGELATMVGHDLRNPLQSIENAAYYLNNELPCLSSSILNHEKAMEMLQVISDSVNYADKIIRDLHDFAATKKLKLEKTDINTTVEETLSQIEAPENVKLVTEMDHLPEIKVDKDMMKRVFLNLAVNGIQALENGGTLKVSTKKRKGFVEVSFKDTGTGIPKENMEKIFTPFFTTKARGMGMGLPICKKFIESHSGSIEVESEEGKETTFTVKLPIQQDNGGENE